jgi:hypothetical protein
MMGRELLRWKALKIVIGVIGEFAAKHRKHSSGLLIATEPRVAADGSFEWPDGGI